MKDYTLFFRRGYKYAMDAADNWYRRRNNIEKATCMYDRNHPDFNKYYLVWQELSKRIEVIGKMRSEVYERQKRQKIESYSQYVMLECYTHTCRYNPKDRGVGRALMITLNDYKSGTHKCDICGKELRTKEDMEIDKTLLGMGIKTNY